MDIFSQRINHVAFVTLNRPAALNALSYEMLGELQRLLAEFAADDAVRAVLIRGAGEKAFCAGGDIRALYQSHRSGGLLHHEFFVAEYRLDYYLHRYPKPYVALLDGITMGGGMGIAQGSPLRIVGERTRMAMPETGIGLFPDVGAGYFLPRLPGALGTYLGLTGSDVRAADALYARLADVYWPPAAVARIEQTFAELSWTGSSGADVRRAVQAHATTDFSAPSLAALRPAIDTHFSKDSIAAILASLQGERRPEFSSWAEQTVQLLRSRSPTMLGVTLRHLRLGRTRPLADCFRTDLGLMRHCFVQGDVLEGVRALLIDKDKRPHWQPQRIEEVTDASVDAFFGEYWPAPVHPLAHLGSA